MTRKHIHFACQFPGRGAVINGLRKASEVIIVLDVRKFLEAGGLLFKSGNDVLLSPGPVISPVFFLHAFHQLPKPVMLWPECGAEPVPDVAVAPKPSSASVVPTTVVPGDVGVPSSREASKKPSRQENAKKRRDKSDDVPMDRDAKRLRLDEDPVDNA